MIKITSQDSQHQYDALGRAITTWDSKKCVWIVNEAFENEHIDWWGKDNAFPGGYKLSEFIEANPNWDKMPNIKVQFFFKDKQAAIKQFGDSHTFGGPLDFWDKIQYPYIVSKEWGYIDVSQKEAIERFGSYCNFNVHAYRVLITYNNSPIYDAPYPEENEDTL